MTVTLYSAGGLFNCCALKTGLVVITCAKNQNADCWVGVRTTEDKARSTPPWALHGDEMYGTRYVPRTLEAIQSDDARCFSLDVSADGDAFVVLLIKKEAT